MSNIDDYNAKSGSFLAIADEHTKSPNYPVDIYNQEAENLGKWSVNDQVALIAAGLDWKLVEDLPARAGALREAESRWFAKRFTREDAQREWSDKSPDAYDKRDQLLHTFTYAYRNMADYAARVSDVREGSSHADMIQDLNDLAVIGNERPEPLNKIKFDMSELQDAADLSKSLGALLATSYANDEDMEILKTRNKAYTYLKEAVDEIRDCGQYVFWRNKERVKGYRSEYLRRLHLNRKRENRAKESEMIN